MLEVRGSYHPSPALGKGRGGGKEKERERERDTARIGRKKPIHVSRSEVNISHVGSEMDESFRLNTTGSRVPLK